MKTIGIDIGTTSISGVVMDNETGKLVQAKTIANNSYIPTENAWEKIQDTSVIVRSARDLIDAFLEQFEDVSAIGLDGQMHGIVYVDENGKAVSPLVTWEDGRGALPCEDASKSGDICNRGDAFELEDACNRTGAETVIERIKRITGVDIPTGYGLCTHTYNVIHNCVPEGAVKVCTIGDYLGMALTGRKTPLMQISNASVFGYFDRKNCRFQTEAMEKMGIDLSLLPEVTEDFEVLGAYREIPVTVAFGDNPASYVGSVGFRTNVPLLNMGTGGQISVLSDQYFEATGIEARPIGHGKYLLAGSSLCGGRAYAILETFFRSYVEAVAGEPAGKNDSQYEVMSRLAIRGAEAASEALKTDNDGKNRMKVSTLFNGTRVDASVRGSISNLSERNFTPENLVYETLYGMAKELYDMYRLIEDGTGMKAEQVVASGNGYRKNPVLQKISEEMFGAPLTLAPYEEEAACGAALTAR